MTAVQLAGPAYREGARLLLFLLLVSPVTNAALNRPRIPLCQGEDGPQEQRQVPQEQTSQPRLPWGPGATGEHPRCLNVATDQLPSGLSGDCRAVGPGPQIEMADFELLGAWEGTAGARGALTAARQGTGLIWPCIPLRGDAMRRQNCGQPRVRPSSSPGSSDCYSRALHQRSDTLTRQARQIAWEPGGGGRVLLEAREQDEPRLPKLGPRPTHIGLHCAFVWT